MRRARVLVRISIFNAIADNGNETVEHLIAERKQFVVGAKIKCSGDRDENNFYSNCVNCVCERAAHQVLHIR